MKENKILRVLAIWTGLLMMLAALVHLVGINNIIIAIKAGDIPATYGDSIIISWIFSGFGFFLLGIWLLYLARELGHMNRRAWGQAFIVAFGLIATGTGCWLIYPHSIHVLFFALVGLILLIPLVFFARGYLAKKKSGTNAPLP